MKKVVSLLLALVMCLSLCACGKQMEENKEIVRKPAVPQVYTFSPHTFYATNAISWVKKKN